MADQSGRRALIGEFCAKPALERLLRDSLCALLAPFIVPHLTRLRSGNYCAQTALDYAEPGQRAQLVEMIRPILRMY